MNASFNRSRFFSTVSVLVPEPEDPPKQPENSDILAAIKEGNAAVLELADAVRANSEAVAAGNAALLEAFAAMSEKLAGLKPAPPIDNAPMLKALDNLAAEVRANKPLKAEATKDRTDELVAALSRVEAAVGTVRAAVLTPVSLEYDRLGEPYQAVRREE